MSDRLTALLDALQHRNAREWLEDFDLAAASQLLGSERTQAVEVLTQALEAGDDPRVPRALVALDAVEAVDALRLATQRAQDRTKVAAALALHVLTSDDEALRATALSVLSSGASAEGRREAATALLSLSGTQVPHQVLDALLDTAGEVCAAAFDVILSRIGLTEALTRRNRLGLLRGWAQLASRWGHGMVASEVPALIHDARQGAPERCLTTWSGALEADALYAGILSHFQEGAPLPERQDLERLSEHDQDIVGLNLARWLELGATRAPEAMATLRSRGWLMLLEERLEQVSGEAQLEVARVLWQHGRSLEAHQALLALIQGPLADRARAILRPPDGQPSGFDGRH
ncbi:MAG: hypothetical protein JXX28_17360 [Deltaproteobacteria bacterium]|nr:hypothetical protein [Deltaproteobacteria bacterium]